MNFIKVLSVACCTIALTGCYSLNMAYEFSGMYLSKEPTEKIYNESGADQKTKEFIEDVDKIREYLKSIEIDPGGAYTSYIEVPRSSVSYGVTAAEKYRLKQKEWFYLFVGNAPYRAFFSENQRDEFMSELALDYDVYAFEVAAFSGLGYFDELLTSPMKRWPRWYLIKTIIHEIIHRNFWVKGSTRLNELVAEYFAIEISKRYFLEKGYSVELETMLASIDRRNKRVKALKETKHKLKKLFDSAVEKAVLEKEKSSHYLRLNQVLYGNTKPAEINWNNARLLLAGMYIPQDSQFDKIKDCVKSEKIADFFEYLKQVDAKKVTKFLTSDKDLAWSCR